MLAGKQLQWFERVRRPRRTTGPINQIAGFQQRGVTLLEVMIAVLVLSVGVLGAASLQLNAIRYSASAGYTTQATLIVRDVLDRMRANPQNLSSYATASVAGVCAPNAGGATIVAQDMADFTQAVTCQLPKASASIATNAGEARVSISWSEARTVANGGKTELTVVSVIR